MDEYTADAFTNRDEAIPVLTITTSDGGSSETEGKHDKIKKSLSASHLQEKLQDISSNKAESGLSLQDRFFAK
jgi:hypothetical protein